MEDLVIAVKYVFCPKSELGHSAFKYATMVPFQI
jgi:hypothetical protein